MKNIILIIILFSSIYNINSQVKDEDYILLDRILPALVKSGGITIYEKQSDFVNQQKFFSEAFFRDFKQPTIGVDSKKIKKLISTLDFNFLSQQKNEISNWDISKLKHSITKYVGDPKNQFDKIRRFKISKPIYSEDFKMAFLYYEDICGFIDCGSANVIILKKCHGQWKIYLTVPIYIS